MQFPSAKWDKLSWFVLSAAVAYGIFARLYNLGRWELTIDEYYLVTAIRSILDNGLPSFGCGGYYERGLLQQYLTAPLMAWSGNEAFAARLIPAFANIAAIPVIYLLARKLNPSRLFAAVATSLFALSLWEIEFARFARMYSLFQLVFILQLYWLVEIIIDGKIGRYKYLLITTALGIFIYQGVIFSFLLCLLPIVLRTDQIKPSHLIGLAITAGLIAARTAVKFRNLNAEPRYPTGYEPQWSNSLPIYLPDLMLPQLSPAWAAITLLLIAGSAWLIFSQARQRGYDFWQVVVIATVLICAAIHQIALATVIAVIAWSLGLLKHQTKPMLIACAAVIGLFSVFWLALGTIYLSLPPAGVVKLLVKYPSVFWYTLGPFIQATPRDVLILFPVLLGCSAYILARVSRSGSISTASLLLGIGLMMLVVQSAFVTPEKSTRYTFFVYPVLLLLLCYALFVIGSLLKTRESWRLATCAGLFLAYLTISENYNLRHLLNVSSAEYNFRIPYHRFLQFHFYQRYSFTDAAEHINGEAGDSDLIISTTPVMDHYLHRMDYSFRDIDSSWFRDTSACSGTRHIWSHSPLIYTEEDLLALVQQAETDTWIVTGENGKGQSPEDQFISAYFEDYMVFRGLDNQVKVYRIPPQLPALESNSSP